jgi:MFS family permease
MQPGEAPPQGNTGGMVPPGYVEGGLEAGNEGEAVIFYWFWCIIHPAAGISTDPHGRMNESSLPLLRKSVHTIVVVAALGYFVDIYDLILFGIVRTASLMDLGYAGDELTRHGIFLLNMQMIGMLVGGILWGVLGDLRGRISVLFGSIILYSLANIANGLVTNLEAYAALRFIAGVGLAGELGAGVTLVAETMSRENRGYGTMVVAGFGVLGAVLASLVGDFFTWRIAYFVGGGLGLLLLVLRIGVYESGMFEQAKAAEVKRGAFHSLFTDARRALKYLCCILLGTPIWYVIGILVILSPEIARTLGVQGTVTASRAIMFAYIGLSAGDFLSGFLSQYFRSRKRVILVFILAVQALSLVYLFSVGMSSTMFYALCLGLGTAAGYWAVFVTNASEQFGTNLRATVTTTVPNFVRGAVVPMTLSFDALRGPVGDVQAALIVGGVCTVLALLSLLVLREGYGEDLNYVEPL